MQDIIDIANIFYFTFQSKSSNYRFNTTMSLKTLHCKMVFEILAISVFFHKYNPFYSMSVKKTNTKYFLFFEVPTHMFPFLKYTPFGKRKRKKLQYF